MGNLFVRPPPSPKSWEEVCLSSDPTHCAKMAGYTLVSAVLSNLIYRVGTDDESTPLTREEFAAKLIQAQEEFPWFRPLRFSMCASVNSDETIFALVEFSSYKVLVVRGSASNADWQVNFTAESFSWKEMEDVHRGFARRAQTIPGEYISRLFDNKTTIFCGHSMGGAAATLAALPLIKRGRDVYAISFGAPSFIKDDPLALHDDLRSRFLRFALVGDVVPMSTKAAGFNSFERLVTLSGGNPCELSCTAEDLPGSTSVIGSITKLTTSKSDTEKSHKMLSYISCIMTVCKFAIEYFSALGGAAITVTDLLKKECVPDIKIEDSSISIIAQRHGNEMNFQVRGEGRHAALVAAAAYDGGPDGMPVPESEKRAISVDYVWERPHDAHADDDTYTFSVVIRATNETVQGAAITTDAVDMFLSISNGFQTVEAKCVFRSENNAAVVGNMGHGKSHLVEALQLHSKGKSEPLEEFNDGVVRAENFKARRFRFEDKVVYETPGLVTTETAGYTNDMAEVFLNHCPKLILLVFRSKNKTDERGLPDFIERLKRFNNEGSLPKMFLVITECHVYETDAAAVEFGKTVLKDIGCGDSIQNIRIFPVNSAISRGRGVVHKPSGIKELWDAILQELTETNPVNPVHIRSWNEYLHSYLTPKASIAASVVMAAGWVVVFKTPPPPLI